MLYAGYSCNLNGTRYTSVRHVSFFFFLLFLILRSATAPACANSFFVVLPKKKVSLSELSLEGSQLRGGPVCHPSGLLERTNGALPSSAFDVHLGFRPPCQRTVAS
jgi:hypothetical protein